MMRERSLFLIQGVVLASLFMSVALFGQQGAYQNHGSASFYRTDYQGITASGEAYHPSLFTGAHETLPLGSWVRVTNLKTGQGVLVRINDRSPFRTGNIINVSYSAAQKLGMVQTGTADVSVVLLPPPPTASGVAIAQSAKPSKPKSKNSPKSLIPVAGSPTTLPPAKDAAPLASGTGSNAQARPAPVRPVYRVEFGSYHDLRRAELAQNELKTLEVDTVIYRRSKVGPGEPYYRLVTTGGFSAQEGATRWLDYIKRQSGGRFLNARVAY